MSERRLTPQRWSVTVQSRWEDREPVVAIALGGWDCVGPGLLECVLRETVDPVEAVDAALGAAQERSLSICPASQSSSGSGSVRGTITAEPYSRTLSSTVSV